MLLNKMIEVQDFSKVYGDFVAVDQISFSVEEGEIFGLLGPNGAGKTSTLECMEGLRKPDGGRIQVTGLEPASEFNKLKNLIGVQLQSGSMPESITPVEAIKLFSAYHAVESRLDLLKKFGLEEKKNSQFFELSTGQQRRLALALAVMHNPKVLFLDEPTAGLDVATRSVLHQMMRDLRESGTTIILATHDMAEAEQMSDRVAILLQGKIIKIGTPIEITAAGAGVTKITVHTQSSEIPISDNYFPAVTHSMQMDDYQIFFSNDIGPTLSSLIAYIEEHNDTLIDLRVERPSLEDRFLEITNTGVNQ
ncbi:MAG: ABC transporter ATP-binding protein [Anaerolineales bacterium]|nr:ABC transporter ATP-binding protein [Anaerolineales bacterium]